MNTAKFNTMLAALEHLTDQQIRRVERVLKGESPEKQVIHAIQQRMVEKPEALTAMATKLNVMARWVACNAIGVSHAVKPSMPLPRRLCQDCIIRANGSIILPA